jgi:lipopolysaccharide/colanic/teichoic acid biosynthesis glycosyltransferase
VHPRSKAEILGRLVYNGFEIIEFSIINNLMYFVVMKTREPLNDPQPTYHALVKLSRVGKEGKMMNVYKFRTMHPYSEYLQDYVIKLNGYNKAGKPANDFRLARWGKIMRKLWLDELPQLINVLKGEMKLVGVRPLSRVRFNEFPEDVQQERIKYKPGCIPPYIALLMPGNSDNLEAERIYFNDLANNPYTTDMKYLLKSIYNIVCSKIKGS